MTANGPQCSHQIVTRGNSSSNRKRFCDALPHICAVRIQSGIVLEHAIKRMNAGTIKLVATGYMQPRDQPDIETSFHLFHM